MISFTEELSSDGLGPTLDPPETVTDHFDSAVLLQYRTRSRFKIT